MNDRGKLIILSLEKLHYCQFLIRHLEDGLEEEEDAKENGDPIGKVIAKNEENRRDQTKRVDEHRENRQDIVLHAPSGQQTDHKNKNIRRTSFRIDGRYQSWPSQPIKSRIRSGPVGVSSPIVLSKK